MSQALESLRFRITKRFGPKVVLDDFALEVRGRQFVTLLGPSGCGKSTALNIVAGLIPASEGELLIDGAPMDHVPTEKRGFGMVFQNYALFPHMTVFGNIAFGLELQRRPAAEVRQRVGEMLSLVQLPGFEERYPSQLSGGQQQRVAIARALVLHPRLLLLDEPLSNLDAKLRVEMRAEIRQLQQQLKITAIYVTHDQEEALAISDRIAVMQSGRLEQVGAPAAIYRTPATPFVAEFMGTTNLFTGVVAGRDGERLRIRVRGQEFAARGADAATGAEITFSLRPETLRLVAGGAAPPPGWASVTAAVSRIEFLGVLTRLSVRLDDGALLHAATLDLLPEGVANGAPVTLAYDPARVTVFHRA